MATVYITVRSARDTEKVVGGDQGLVSIPDTEMVVGRDQSLVSIPDTEMVVGGDQSLVSIPDTEMVVGRDQGLVSIPDVLVSVLQQRHVVHLQLDHDTDPDQLDTAAHAVVSAVWTPQHERLELLEDVSPPSLLRRVVERYVRKTLPLTHQDDPQSVLRLSSWIRSSCLGLTGSGSVVAEGMSRDERDLASSLVNVCLQHGALEAAVVVAAMIPDWERVRCSLVKVGVAQGDPSRLLLFLVHHAPRGVVRDAIVSLLGGSKVHSLQFCAHTFTASELLCLADVCREHGLHEWTVFFHMHSGAWQRVRHSMQRCQNPDTVDLVLVNACRLGRWDVVQDLDLLSRCSSHSVMLASVFRSAVRWGHAAVVERLLTTVDLSELCGTDTTWASSVFSSVALLFSSRVAERLARLCVLAGLSTHCTHQATDILVECLQRRRPSLAKLFVLCGVASRAELKQALEDPNLLEQDGEGRLKDVFQGMKDSGVKRLEEMSRLRVSHLIGVWPGRGDRIGRLPCPAAIQRSVSFENLCAECLLTGGEDASWEYRSLHEAQWRNGKRME